MSIRLFYNFLLFFLVFSFVLLAIGMPFCSFDNSLSYVVSFEQCSLEVIQLKSHFVYFKQLLDVYPSQSVPAVLIIIGIVFLSIKQFDFLLGKFYFWLKLSWYSIVWQPLRLALAQGLIKRKHLDNYKFY